MTRRPNITVVVTAGALATVAGLLPFAGASAQSSPAPQFAAAQRLPKWSGGEPSIAADPSGNGAVYVTAPQFIPAALNGPTGTGAGPEGIGFWASTDHGRTYP